MRTDKLTIPAYLDRHFHFREDEMLAAILPFILRSQAAGAVGIGNLKHPNETSTIEKTAHYRQEIEACIPPGSDFQLFMTCFLADEITPDEIVEGFKRGVWCAAKIMLAGPAGSTNSEYGVKNFRGRYSVFAAMEKVGMPILFHCEATDDGLDEFEREYIGLYRYLDPMVRAFPDLKVVFEHISDGRCADYVAEGRPNLFATVTAHHLLCDSSALFVGGLNPLHWCKPVLKSREHQRTVRRYVTSGHPRFGAGTDSAAHDRRKKAKTTGCSAGICIADAAPALYATVFDQDNAMEHFEAFMSRNFIDVYGAKLSNRTMTLVREPSTIPTTIETRDGETVEVFMGGQTLPWKLVGR
jgi:dihydroorotase